jgi:diaminohydroxyphosphoribosylaminopyrimidine deaminase / 5-amino-6-(5-phosphoribosylamino)uracil reductase
MRMALRLAEKAAGRTSPNPMVGAVLVRGGKIIATGYHRQAGGDHAELDALKRAGTKARGATLYLNLEPCSHYGRTPPCVNALIAARVKRVVAGMADPNPLVSGRGFRRLRQAGIKVRSRLLEAECRALNEAFVKYITRGMPFVLLKTAASLDGKIATATGNSRWVTGREARRRVHELRNRVDAVMVGIGTVIADDPQLTCRIPDGRNPIRIILDQRLRIPLKARVLNESGKAIVVTGGLVPQKKLKAVEMKGAEVWRMLARRRGISLTAVLQKIAAQGILSVMIEGGSVTAGRALAEKVVDKIAFFYASKVVGGDGLSVVSPLGVKNMRQSIPIKNVEVERIDNDILVTGYL